MQYFSSFLPFITPPKKRIEEQFVNLVCYMRKLVGILAAFNSASC